MTSGSLGGGTGCRAGETLPHALADQRRRPMRMRARQTNVGSACHLESLVAANIRSDVDSYPVPKLSALP